MVEQVLVNSSSLSSIGDAIRTKKGLPAESKFTPSEMSEQINSMPVVPEEGLTITGNCDALFKGGKFSFMINVPGVKTKDITSVQSMFYNCTNITEIPFDLNFIDSSVPSISMFQGCEKLKKLPRMNNYNMGSPSSYCNACFRLEDVSSLASVNLESFHDNKHIRYDSMFNRTFRLKEIPYSFLSNLYNINTGWKYTIYDSSTFNHCGVYALKGLPVLPYEYTENNFTDSSCFAYMPRLKSLTFDMDGTSPKVVK